ncbi:S26 family signal peptidase [Nonomuraea sp. NPDC050643]|uniref:S26 family signal peptidase n=1 Tax=Nonomuraea sp. NPDC050643 TaxID=3155660 RepID=UPI0033D114EE
MTPLVVMGLAGLIAGVPVVWWVRRRYLVVTVHGESMVPAYLPGERVLVRRTAPGALRAGQVVVLREFAAARPDGDRVEEPRPQWIIKRVAAVPGDAIPRDTVPALRTAPGTLVPAGRLVVLGDNPARSHDSRHTGYLTADRLFGVVLRKVE